MLPDFSGCPAVGGDGDKLFGCFQEILNNAIDAGSDQVFIKFNVEALHLVLSFADNGDGMSKEIADVAELPFFTTKGTSKTGLLGLWSTSQYLKSIGGDIRLNSEAGKGTTIELLLPVLNSEE